MRLLILSVRQAIVPVSSFKENPHFLKTGKENHVSCRIDKEFVGCRVHVPR